MDFVPGQAKPQRYSFYDSKNRKTEERLTFLEEKYPFEDYVDVFEEGFKGFWENFTKKHCSILVSLNETVSQQVLQLGSFIWHL